MKSKLTCVLAAAAVSRLAGGKTDVVMMLNGAIAGLVGITAEPLAPSPLAAIVIGAIAGVLMYYSTKLLYKMKIDDVVGAIPAHLVAGIWGTLAVPFTNTEVGFGSQFLGTISVVVFVFVVSYIVWSIMKATIGIRISKEAERLGKTIHFGRVFPLCQVKHSKLAAAFQKYKGRVVFSGNDIRDENGVQAVFAEQGASASSMVNGKVLDALARIPGYAGQNADAVKAYTQVRLADFEGETETWVELPQDRWPASWFGADGSCKYVRPVVRLLANLYGHPLAGLWWEKHCHNKVIKCGYQRLQGWECLYQHPEEKAALSVYVDDLKLCGPSGALPRLWKELMKHLKLEPPTEFHDSVYLGCQQQDYETTQEDIDAQNAYWNQVFYSRV